MLGRTLLDAAPVHKDTVAMKQMHRQNGSVRPFSCLPAQDISRTGHGINDIFPVVATVKSGATANSIPKTLKKLIPQLHDWRRRAAVLFCDLLNRMSKQSKVWCGALFSTRNSTGTLSCSSLIFQLMAHDYSSSSIQRDVDFSYSNSPWLVFRHILTHMVNTR